MSCYSLIELNFDWGHFDDIVDEVYILICCKDDFDKKFKNVMKKLKQQNVHKKVIIVKNEGYKNCNKNKNVNTTWKDLSHAVKYILELNNNDKNTMILEDDFYFDTENLTTKNLNEIENFTKTKEFDIYSLGSQGNRNDFNLGYHTKLSWAVWSHCFIYSPSGKIKYLNEYMKNNGNIMTDQWYNNNKNFNFYRFWIPLCFQHFAMTENRKTWDTLSTKIQYKLLNMETEGKSKFGFYVFYFYELIIVLLLLIIFHYTQDLSTYM